MDEQPALRMILGGTDATGAEPEPLFLGNSIAVTLSGFSADLLERHRRGSDRPDEIVGALYEVLDAVRPAALDGERQRQALVHQLAGTTAVTVSVVLSPAQHLSSSPHRREEFRADLL